MEWSKSEKAALWGSFRVGHLSMISCSVGGSSVSSESEKNCEIDMPNALQIASSVGIDCIEFLLNMLHTVLICSPLSFDKRYIVQPLSCVYG